jgi:hypothetical protein
MMTIDDNVKIADSGSVLCTHCDGVLGASSADPFEKVIRRERPSTPAEPGVHAPPIHFTDRPITVRQAFCPNCLTLLAMEIVPGDEPGYRHWTLKADDTVQ